MGLVDLAFVDNFLEYPNGWWVDTLAALLATAQLGHWNFLLYCQQKIVYDMMAHPVQTEKAVSVVCWLTM